MLLPVLQLDVDAGGDVRMVQIPVMILKYMRRSMDRFGSADIGADTAGGAG